MKNLSQEEKNQLYKAPLLVCLLIAGADDNIDNNEISESIRQAKENAKRSESFLFKFYNEIARDFKERLKKILDEYPAHAAERNPLLIKELSGLNNILAKTDKTFSIVYYNSLKEIAARIAKSSGGIMGIHAISAEEKAYIDLPMINDPSKLFHK